MADAACMCIMYFNKVKEEQRKKEKLESNGLKSSQCGKHSITFDEAQKKFLEEDLT